MAEQRLWAPWRMKYVQAERKDEGCIFCLAAQAGDDETRHVAAPRGALPGDAQRVPVQQRSPHGVAAPASRLDRGPRHRRARRADDARPARTARAQRDAYQPHGFNLGVNEGEVAVAGFAGHVHLHVVPRWAADSNFMAVTADTRVLPQSLQDTYATLRSRLG